MSVQNRTVFSNDNLPILRGIDAESVDLIYLDPPFNSNRNYAAPIGSDAAGAAFKDTWTLSDVDNAWHGEIADREPALSSFGVKTQCFILWDVAPPSCIRPKLFLDIKHDFLL